MKDDTLSFKEKYLRLRERFDRVSTTQRQFTNDLQTARLKTRKLREENKPSSDSDTSMEDLSDLDDTEDEEMNEDRLHSDKPHQGRSYRKTTDSSRKDIPTDDGGSLPPEPHHRTAGFRGMTRDSKRADRGRPRLVVPLKTNTDGSLSYPIVVGKGTNEVIIENMGRIVWNGRGYHNHRYIFPVGFRSKKQYTSLSDTSKKTYFISEILDGGEQPIFQITLEDMPEKVFRHSSSSGAWELALKGLMELGFNAKTHASGPDMYGLTNLGVIKYIQEMPNAHRCRRYMPLKWIIDEENVEGGSPDSSGQGFKSYDGKPGSRRKKFNNSLYASNHDVLLSTLEEAAASSASSHHKVPTTPPSRPYTPRKYTRRKVLDSSANDPTPLSPPPPQLSFSSPPPHEYVGSYTGGYHHSIDYDHEDHELDRTRQQQQHHHHQQQQQQHHMARATTPLSSTVTTAAAAAAMPRSITGQGPYYPERFPSHPPQPPPQSNTDSLHAVRGKDPRDHYDSYQKPLMEP
ncbi:choline dehydrogenase 7 [Mortierella sp. AD032]|nr:choline dehydrogenase 7 [Mortierella sp. AD032]